MIAIPAFGSRPHRGWVVDGLQCCTYAGFAGALNGYVRLPLDHPDLLLAQAAELGPGAPFLFPDGVTLGVNYPRGYDHVGVDVPGGWTYGPDEEGWVGFDTNHVGDTWTKEQRLENVGEDASGLARLEVWLKYEDLFGWWGDEPWARHWTVEQVEAEVETAARILAMRAHAARTERLRLRNEGGHAQ